MTDGLEFPICALCGSDSYCIVHAHVRDLIYGLPGHFALVKCRACGLVYLSPRPTKDRLPAYYPDTYAPCAPPSAMSDHVAPQRSVRTRHALHATIVSVGRWCYRRRFGPETTTLPPFGQRRLLDIGCGAGAYLEEMQTMGWDVYGVEPSANAVHIANARIGAPRVWAGTLETLDPALTDFDLITMNHTLEHVPDPRATLEQAYLRLAGDGKLKIIVPDVSGFEARFFGRYWVGLDVPRHLYDFSRQTLRTLLHQCGFQVTSVRPQWWLHGFAASFDLAAESRLHLRSSLVRRILSRLLFMLFLFSYPLGNRGAIEVVAVKRLPRGNRPTGIAADGAH